jgi:nucleotide-binding universal stress UspA family protein
MSSTILVAYDGSTNADDAVALGRLLAQLTGSQLALAHIYRAGSQHGTNGAATIEARDRFLRRRGEDLLERAAASAGVDARHIVVAATTTATGMRTLAEQEGATAVVFGSASNTEPGHVHPGSASRRLLQGAPSALAFAPVGYRESPSTIPGRIGISHDDDDATARHSAEAIVGAIGSAATLVDEPPLDLLLIGSRPGAEHGRVMIGASAEAPLHAATSPVVVVARGVALPSAAATLASVA